MTTIRGGSGLGDSIYLRPLIGELVRRGGRVAVMSDYPDVFVDSGATVEAFRRNPVDRIFHYVGGKNCASTNIWQDLCAHARIEVPLKFSWLIRNEALVARVRREAAGRPIVLVHGGREPMGRRDGFGLELLPESSAFVAAVEALEGCYTVRVGAGNRIYELPYDLDLWGQTSPGDLLDLAWVCAGVVAQCSFAIPMAEAFDKPLLVVWAVRGLQSSNTFIKTVTPSKMLTKATSIPVGDDNPLDVIRCTASDWSSVLACAS